MSMAPQITPVILTYNEGPNIGRCLARLNWAHDIVVVDSGSTDETESLCRAYPQVRWFVRPFDSHAEQWTFAVRQTSIISPWVLALDADYMLSEAAWRELERLEPGPELNAYWTSFDYAIFGKVLRSGIYPPVQTLYRPAMAQYVQDGHTQRLVVEGASGKLSARLIHDDRKPLDRWVRSQLGYASLEADREDGGGTAGLGGWLRAKTPFSVLAVGFYCLIVRGGLLDGPPGWFYAVQRMVAEGLICAARLERRLMR